LRAHADDGLDAARFASWGDSAGGHLAAMLGTAAHEHRFDMGEHLRFKLAPELLRRDF
jgi:acetyl esterase/lipase